MGVLAWARLVHVCCSQVSITGFALRGYWMLTGIGLRHGIAERCL